MILLQLKISTNLELTKISIFKVKIATELVIDRHLYVRNELISVAHLRRYTFPWLNFLEVLLE